MNAAVRACHHRKRLDDLEWPLHVDQSMLAGQCKEALKTGVLLRSGA